VRGFGVLEKNLEGCCFSPLSLCYYSQRMAPGDHAFVPGCYAQNQNTCNKEREVTERFLAVLLGLLLSGSLLSGSAVAADFLVEVRVQVQRGCMLINQQRDAGAQALGRIDLGAAARLDGPGAPLSGVLLNQRPPRLECNPDTQYQVRVDGGQHGGAGELRFLASEDAQARPIPYRLYRDAAWREPVAVGEPHAARVPDSGTVELPLYARIDKLAWVPRAGQYADLLKVTVTW